MSRESKLKKNIQFLSKVNHRMLMKARLSKRMLVSLCKCNEISGKQA